MKPLNSLLLWVKFTSLIRIGFHADQWRGMTYFSPFDPSDQSNAWDRIPIYNSRLSKQFFNFFLFIFLSLSLRLSHSHSVSLQISQLFNLSALQWRFQRWFLAWLKDVQNWFLKFFPLRVRCERSSRQSGTSPIRDSWRVSEFCKLNLLFLIPIWFEFSY